MRVQFLEPARDELWETIRYYNFVQPGLGNIFQEEVRAAIERIRRMPEAWTPLSKHTRRCLIHRFPYGVIYEVRRSEILIVAVSHLHREPEHWKDRTDKT